jgi:hypothetical protein
MNGYYQQKKHKVKSLATAIRRYLFHEFSELQLTFDLFLDQFYHFSICVNTKVAKIQFQKSSELTHFVLFEPSKFLAM